MNDLGLTLAWTAVRVSLVLIPAAALHAVASRRSPASGAWVAAMGLGLVVAVSLLSLAPRGGVPASTSALVAMAKPAAAAAPPRDGNLRTDSRPDDGGTGWPVAGLRGVLGRLEAAAAGPADRCRPWGGVLAAVALTGSAGGLLRLTVAAWAVHLCRRRSRPVGDPELSALLDELRADLGCGRRVEPRETCELTTPATAGWRRPVLLLPEDWRSWDGHERRAVLAHELAHVCRDDYATGLAARVALALHFYHPLVHWLVNRLQLEQELAADALGARFAGGRVLYLQSLSRLALRQDGRSPCWPARAFLPAKGTLIRRIAMLREETKSTDRPWSGPRRTLAALFLLTAAAGALSLHGPARADDRDKPAEGGAEYRLGDLKLVGTERRTVEPVDLSYFPEDTQGLVTFRPRAVFRREGMAQYRTMLNLWIGREWSKAAKALGFDPTKPGQGPLRVEMFEQVTTMLTFTRTGGKKPDGRLYVGNVFTARTTEPVDWLTLCRLFKQDLKEVHDGDRVYYKINNPMLGPDGCVFFPDDRTLVFADENHIREYLRRKGPAPGPAFVKGKDWDRLVRGLGVVALDNRGGRLAKVLVDLDFEDDDLEDPFVRALPGLLDHTDFWTFGLDHDDEIVFRAVATCADDVASGSTARAAETLLALCRIGVEGLGPAKPPHREGEEKARQMALDFLKNAIVERDGRSVLVRSAGLGTIADLATLVAAGVIN